MAKEQQLAVLRALVDVSSVDLLCSDLYLHRAGELLPAVLGRDEYAVARADRVELPRLTEALRRASERAEWGEVKALAAEATVRQAHAAASPGLDVAEVVYGPRFLRLGPAALGFAGLAAYSQMERERTGLVERLSWLATADPDWRPLYERRAAAFQQGRCIGRNGSLATVDDQALRVRVLDAVGREDFATVQELVHGVGGGSRGHGVDDADGTGERLRIAPPVAGRAGAIRVPIPSVAIDRAAALGLVPEVLPADPQWERYLSGGCADPAAPPWPAVEETLDFLVVRKFMTSGGTRYVPWFGEESLLVEPFPETQPDGPTPLLERLGLTRRRGLSRLAVEDAVRSHSVEICTEIGLDPFEFVLAPIPFDAYLRLAKRYDWGTHALWTHFDGYQVASGSRLRALVGGDVRYGGAGDLCAVQRDYDVDRITTRFSIVHRDRFLIRATESG